MRVEVHLVTPATAEDGWLGGLAWITRDISDDLDPETVADLARLAEGLR